MNNDYDLDDLHIALMDIIRFFNTVCEQSEVDYYLKGGSALGAVRHSGFIPWDDDFDVIMHRIEFDNLLPHLNRLAKQNGYHLQYPNTDENPYFFAKLKKENTYLEEIANKGTKTHEGIYIDIFFFANAYESNLLVYVQYLVAKLFVAYSLTKKNYFPNTISKKILMKLSIILNLASVRNLLMQFVNGPKYSSRCVDLFERGSLNNNMYERSIIGKPVRLKFEGIFLPVFSKYHEYLSIKFGNYLQLPTEEEKLSAMHSISYKLKLDD